MTKTKAKPKKPTKEQRAFVRLVKQARKAWTLEDMSTHLGVSFSSVSRWANGESIPHRNTVTRLTPLIEELV